MNMKRKRRIVLIAAFSIAFMTIMQRSTPLHAEELGRAVPIYDGHNFIKSSLVKKVSQPREIKLWPLFDNAPFLRLKPGDKLIKGCAWRENGKAVEPAFAKRPSWFVMTDGKYYEMQEIYQRNGKLILVEDYYSVLFDWKPDLKSATTLYNLNWNEGSSDGFGENLLPNSLPALKVALRKDFPETLRDVGKVHIDKPHMTGKKKTRRAIFQGLGFDAYRNAIFKYQLEVGNDIYVQYRENLIVGPRRVEREEFEGVRGGYINGPASRKPDPKTAAKARAAYDRMIKFQAIVNKFLVEL